MKAIFQSVSNIVTVIVFSLVLISATYTITTTYMLPQVVKAVKVEKTFDFAGETMPLNPDTRERLDRELSVNAYWQSSTLLNIKLAYKHFPMIERILAEEGIPDDFKYLAVAESGLRNVGSHAGAKGYWQFMTGTGKEYGLEINSEVDERYHLEKSTRAAAKYIKWMYKKFGNYTNAAGAYNVGPTKFTREMKSQGEQSYYNLNLNLETSRYVFRLLAIKEILKNPEQYGFYLDPADYYQPEVSLKDIVVNTTVPSWKEFAKKHGLTYRMLKFYNPWIIDNKLTVINNTYKVKVPL